MSHKKRVSAKEQLNIFSKIDASHIFYEKCESESIDKKNIDTKDINNIFIELDGTLIKQYNDLKMKNRFIVNHKTIKYLNNWFHLVNEILINTEKYFYDIVPNDVKFKDIKMYYSDYIIHKKKEKAILAEHSKIYEREYKEFHGFELSDMLDNVSISSNDEINKIVIPKKLKKLTKIFIGYDDYKFELDFSNLKKNTNIMIHFLEINRCVTYYENTKKT